MRMLFYQFMDYVLSYDIASGSEITPCNKIDKPLVVYRCSENVMKSKTTMRTKLTTLYFLKAEMRFQSYLNVI